MALSPPTLPHPSPPSPDPQSPVDNQVDDAASTDNDEDTLRRLMQNFPGHGSFGSAGHGGDSESCSDAESSGNDDVEYLRHLQEQFLLPYAVGHASGNDDTPSIIKPIRSFPPSDMDDDEDIETLRAIQRRFACYCREVTLKDFSPETSSTVIAVTSEGDPNNLPWTLVISEEPQDQSVGLLVAGDETSRLSVYPKFGKKFLDAPCAVSSDTFSKNRTRNEDYPEHSHIDFNEEDTLCNLSVRHFISPKFPKSVQNFIEALKKNRSCQRFIRDKLVEIEAKREINRELKERIKCVMDFHHAYRRKLGNNLFHKRDARIRLISLRNQRSSRKVKQNSKDSSALHLSPDETPQLSNYDMVMRRFPVSLRERQWSDKEKGELLKGINQQYQEKQILKYLNGDVSDFDGSVDSVIMSTIDSVNYQAMPEILRSFIPSVNWETLASTYLPTRSGPSCESRWLNHEDPLVNHNPWTLLEDKKLLFTVQERGLYNWIDIAVTLGTNRTPFQCLVRYQRSLNPHILNREWTSDEDAKLFSAVETFGDNNWQIVASHLDGRASNQCSVRWRNTLLPGRKRVGRWSVEEDKRLKVSVTLFGAKNWKTIAHFVPGRTQSQCRERWLNCLDPSLNLEKWTEVEDSKLLAAIAEHGHSWAKVAASIPGRTDNHCRRRWKVLLPHEVPMLKAAQQLKKTVLISNFVGRESERPALGPSDFTPIIRLAAPSLEDCIKSGEIMSRKQLNPANKLKESRPNKFKKARKRFKRSTEENSTDNCVMTEAFGNASLLGSENGNDV